MRKRLTEIAQLLQVYWRLAELELAAGKKPERGHVSLPEGTPERIAVWAEGEEAEVREREELVEELSVAMRAHGHDPGPIQQVTGR